MERPLEFWRAASEYPVLQRVARRLLAVPATNTAAEGTGALVGRGALQRRATLQAELAETRLLVRGNRELLDGLER